MEKELKHSPHFVLIDDDLTLKIACEQAAEKKVIALDTEFVRIRSFFPKLGLIQLYDGEQVSLIDPNEITDFSPFKALLANERVLKVLHACYEDLEVFKYHFQQFPTPMIDTQVMANFIGFPTSTGLASLLAHYFQFELDKDASRTDWLARPLSEKQLKYAASDVWYLLPLYQRMVTDLAKTPWQSAVKFDCELLIKKQYNAPSSDKAYLNIPNAWRLQAHELARLQVLAKWRYEEAIRRDLALNFVVRSENLWLVAKHAPKHSSELVELGLSTQEVRIHGKKLLWLVVQGNRVETQNYPPKVACLTDNPLYKSSLRSMQQKLKSLAENMHIAPEVIASRRGLESLMKWVWWKELEPSNLPDLMLDWRKPVGEQLLPYLLNKAFVITEMKE